MRGIKSLLLSLVMVFGLVSNSFAWSSYNEFNEDMGKSDWNTELHLGLGGVIAAGTIYFLPKEMSPVTKWFIGFGAGLIGGCISESLDKNWDNKDLAQWGLGGAMGSSLMLMDIKFSL
jgi:CRISPR/Cas system CSM-associated protein Csm5 (group 7 of RAMP superfamily)